MAAALPAIAIGTSLIGGAASAYGSIKSGNANYQAGMYQAAVSDQNAQRSDYQATQALQEGDTNIAKVKRNAAQAIGSQRASLAGMGQLLGTGSATEIVKSTAQQGAEDAATAAYNAQKTALGFRLQASDFRNDATLQRSGASSARTAGLINAAGTLLTTAGNAGSMSYDFSRTSFKAVGKPTWSGPR